MAMCETCGNDYDKPITVTSAGEHHLSDSFECAIHPLAPVCSRCGVRVIGHGVESGERMFCGASCAHAAGVATVRDRA